MSNELSLNSNEKDKSNYKLRIVWRNVITITTIHILAIYGYYLAITSAKWQTIHFAYFFTLLGSLFGITAG